jgi:uncharacterized protein YdhG (YjbR/CyaY superfamily)
MAQSNAKTVASYLKGLPADRRAVMAAVLGVVRANMPKGYEEVMAWGYPTWQIPLSRYPDTYNKKPLCYAALAAQKNHNAIYLMGVYQSPKQQKALEAAFKKAGKKLDMGKSCVRFKQLDDLPLPAIGKIIASTTPAQYIETYEGIRAKG